MQTYAIYELIELFNGKMDMKKREVVKATNSETAIRKYLIGTSKKYENIRAYLFTDKIGGGV